MQPMLDKELDLLFKQKFETFEPEVNPTLWNGITAHLGEERKAGRKFPYAWMAAASAVIIVSVSVLLMQSPAPLKLRGKGNGQLALHTSAVKPGLQVLHGPDVEKKAVQEFPVARHTRPVIASGPAAEKPQPVRVPEFNSQPAPEMITALQTHQAEQQPPQNSVDAVSIKNSFRAVTNMHGNTPVLTATAAIDPAAFEQDAPKKKIKSLGGLVNYVVGKVDKRENKIIEFTDNDEGTEVTGINLGLFKIKAKNNTTNK